MSTDISINLEEEKKCFTFSQQMQMLALLTRLPPEFPTTIYLS